jgi:hypothetical protein
LLYLENTLGELTTRDQIIRASDYLDDQVDDEGDEEERFRKKAFDLCVATDPINSSSIWLDINFYRLIGDVPASVITEYDTNEGLPYKDMHLIAQRWASLSLHGRLGSIRRFADVQAVKQQGGSPSQILGAWLERYRRRNGFDKWNREHMREARLSIVEIWKERQPQRA